MTGDLGTDGGTAACRRSFSPEKPKSIMLAASAYQRQGIGGKRIEMMKEKCKDYLRVILIALDNETGFYEHLGFEKADGKSPMQITKFWT